jgi:hypothetical protein
VQARQCRRVEGSRHGSRLRIGASRRGLGWGRGPVLQVRLGELSATTCAFLRLGAVNGQGAILFVAAAEENSGAGGGRMPYVPGDPLETAEDIFFECAFV